MLGPFCNSYYLSIFPIRQAARGGKTKINTPDKSDTEAVNNSSCTAGPVDTHGSIRANHEVPDDSRDGHGGFRNLPHAPVRVCQTIGREAVHGQRYDDHSRRTQTRERQEG